jgi:acetylglutamate kinase
MQELIDKAAVLQEALPYIRRFHGAIFVIKYGGHAMVDPELRSSFARDVALLKFVGLNPVVVHGGGPQVDAVLTSMGAASERVDGLRVTDDKTMEVVEMVLGGRVNQEIVSLICGHGGRAVGLTGKDDSLLLAKRLTSMTTRSGNEVDPGRVGRVERVRPQVVQNLVQTGYIPVLAPVAIDAEGGALNVNADTVAGEVASALAAHKLVLMTDTDGVKDDRGEVISSLSSEQAERLREAGTIQGGMIPKVRCALDALEGGVLKAHIIDGRVRHAVLLEIFTDTGIGTEITP